MNNVAYSYCDKAIADAGIKYPRCGLQRLSEKFRHE